MRLARLDKVMSWVVKVLYVAALGTSFYAFFSGQAVSEKWLNVAFSLALSAALILHELLSQLRFGVATAALFRVKRSDSRFGSIAFQAASNGAMMLALLAFDIYCSFEYQATVKNYGHAVPLVAQITIQGTAVPMLFFLSTFLLQFHPDAASVLSQHSLDMLYRTLKVAKRQWSTRLNKAEKDGTNFAPIVVTLMEDNGDSESAQRIKTIESGLMQTERNGTMGKSSKLYLPPAQAQSGAARNNFPNRNSGANSPSDSTEESGMKLRKTLSFRKPRSVVKRTKRDRVFRILDGDSTLSISAVVAKTGMDRKTVTKYYTEWMDAHSIQLEAGG